MFEFVLIEETWFISIVAYIKSDDFKSPAELLKVYSNQSFCKPNANNMKSLFCNFDSHDLLISLNWLHTTQKMKFSIKDFFSNK